MTSTAATNSNVQPIAGDFEKIIDKAKKWLKVNPKASQLEFFETFLQHAFIHVRTEVAAVAERLDDVEDALEPAELELLDDMDECLAETSVFVDKILVAGGFLTITGDKREFTAKFDQIKDDFEDIAETWQSMNESIKEHREAYDAGPDDPNDPSDPAA